MPLHPLVGHDEVRATLARGVHTRSLPQSILLHGPAGIGKQRLGLWLAQLLVCEAPRDDGPCDACLPCRLALRLEHPDVHWFFPLPRPEATSPEKLRERLEEARAAELAVRRQNPLHLPTFEKAPAHFLASVLTLQQMAAVRPAMGRRKAFVVGDAEAMVPQESSPEAANAFLKLLEEPPADTTLVLTATQPGALLPTIRSRVLPVRLLPLGAAQVAGFLAGAGLADVETAERAAALAQGSIGRALRLLPGAEAATSLEAQRRAGRELLLAALADSAAERFALALRREGAGARHELPALLDALAAWLRDLVAVLSGAEELALNRDGLELLRRAAQRGVRATAAARALERVERARALAHGNVNPQLIVANLLTELHHDLRGAA